MKAGEWKTGGAGVVLLLLVLSTTASSFFLARHACVEKRGQERRIALTAIVQT